MRPNTAASKMEGGKRCQGSFKEKPGYKPLVSIITAVYYGNATIEETIKSVLSQKDTSFEYLIIDGGSTDGTIETLIKYDNKIDYWLSEPDKGIYDALNKGIDLARGEWLYFIGSDDIFVNDHVLTDIFSQPLNTRMLYGNVMWGNTGQIYDKKFSKTKLYYKNICQQAIFYKRDLFQQLGHFETQYSFLADWVFNIKAFSLKNTNPVYINTIVANFAIEGRSLSIEDTVFAQERDKLIKDFFGFWHYVNYKWFHGTMKRLSELWMLFSKKISLRKKLII